MGASRADGGRRQECRRSLTAAASRLRSIHPVGLTLETAVDPVFEAEEQGVLLWKVPTAEQLKITHLPKANFL